MAGKRTITGLDIGSHEIRVIIAEYTPGEGLPRIVGTGLQPSRGMRHGYITSGDEVVRAVRAAIAEAEAESGTRVHGAFISVGGVGLESALTTGSAVVSRADNTISHADLERAMRAAETALPNPANKKILLTVPAEYRIDSKKIYGRPVGMRGLKLDVAALVVTATDQHLADLIDVVEEAGLEVEDIQAAPIAESFVALTKEQKMAGCILANIGAETLSIVVYEEGVPVSMEVFPTGSENITNDIALGLRIPLEDAEVLKLGQNLPQLSVPKKKLADIIDTRLEGMFAYIVTHLKKIGKNELLPAGIILSGNGSRLAGLTDAAMKYTKLHARIPKTRAITQMAEYPRIGPDDSSWFVAYGLAVMGASQGSSSSSYTSSSGGFWEAIKRGLRQLLP